MKITYKSLTVDEAFELIKEDSKRKDLYFEKGDKKEPPSELCNMSAYDLDVVHFSKRFWFQREVEDGSK